MGIAEKAQEVELWQREHAIEEAHRSSADLEGPATCIRCDEPNDRGALGYAVCTDCMSDAR